MSYNYQQGYSGGQYGAPPPGQYSQGGYQQPGYGAPPNQYAPPPGPSPGQHPSQGGYQQPAYGAPQHTQYAPPSGPPPSQYGQNHYAPPAGPPPSNHYAPPVGPPPGQYAPPSGPPHQQYAPPPGPSPGQYPSQSGYQQPGYGAPPQQYGAPPGPPPGQFGHHNMAPIPTGGHGFPVPPMGQPTPATLGYGPPQTINWDAGPTAAACRKAMKGFGTNEKLLIDALADKDPLQIEAIKASFRNQFGRDLLKDVKSETSGDFEFGLLAILRGPCLNDAYEVQRAVEGSGTNERALNDVLLGRSNADILAIKNMYRQAFRRDMDKDVRGDLSFKTARMFDIILSAQRAEDSVLPNPQQIDSDVRDLYNATECRAGTDEIRVCSIMALRNDAQIRAIADAYKRTYSRDLESVFKSEFSGHMEDALVYQLRSAVNPYDNAAQELERAMRGVGTDEKALARRLISIHWNRTFMEAVKVEYHQRYRSDLVSRVRGELGGDFERLMLACLGHPC